MCYFILIIKTAKLHGHPYTQKSLNSNFKENKTLFCFAIYFGTNATLKLGIYKIFSRKWIKNVTPFCNSQFTVAQSWDDSKRQSQNLANLLLCPHRSAHISSEINKKYAPICAHSTEFARLRATETDWYGPKRLLGHYVILHQSESATALRKRMNHWNKIEMHKNIIYLIQKYECLFNS